MSHRERALARAVLDALTRKRIEVAVAILPGLGHDEETDDLCLLAVVADDRAIEALESRLIDLMNEVERDLGQTIDYTIQFELEAQAGDHQERALGNYRPDRKAAAEVEVRGRQVEDEDQQADEMCLRPSRWNF
ncbi:MAG: hypothetical protein H6807_06630 [Planctomycetes bacterium]|nr:hypothetical protein [Planctomycetota bacterium]